MGVFERSASRFAMVLEQQNVAQAGIAFQVEDAIAESPKEIFDPLFGKIGERDFVVRTLDDHFVRAHAAHSVVETLALAIERSFDAKSRELIGNHAQIPMAVAVFTIREDLRRGIGFVAKAKGTTSIRLGKILAAGEIAGAPGATGGDDHPTTGY